MGRIETDLCIIGAGSGGLALAAGAVQMGARVVLVEAHKMGGDCLNYGCVPSKALLAAAARAQAVREGGFGVAPSEPEVDYAAAKDHVASVIGRIAPHDSQERFESLGVTVIRAWGAFLSERELQAGDDVIAARRFVVATGSSPLVPPIPGLDEVPYLTNETLWDLRERPEHLLVIGGGPIGMEMAQAHRRLGSRVTVIEGDRALNRDDPEAAAILLARLREEGIEIVEGQQAARVSGTAGAIALETADGTVHSGSHLLVAVGRRTNLDGLNLSAAGVETTRAGVTVGPDLRSSNRRIYAIGDAAGGMQFTHVAAYHAGIVIRSALLGLPSKARTDHIPRVTYCDPELAQVGLTEAEARNTHGDRVEVARFDFDGNDRALATGRGAGFVKVMAVRGRPVGVTIVGAEAGELISTWALALSSRLRMSAVAGMVAPYPTLSEVNKRAAGAYFSHRLFDSPWVKRAVRFVQKVLP